MEISTQQVAQDLFQLLDRVKICALSLAEAQGLTRVQLFALYSISLHGELAMRQAADVLHCDASNVTGIVDRLVNQQLITREENVRDRRTKNLRLTDKGTQIVHTLQEALPAKLNCEKLSAEERQTLHRITEKLCTIEAAE
ncbi:MAG TPA: MarR family transcriptional regulator [Candidatus Saccharimonadales bacterium]|nr:MarR family transcriptional regulator [Candidatus Saccharimonadales bacterium]